MAHATVLIEQVTEQEADWLFSAGQEQVFRAGDAVITAEEPVDSFLIVLEGLLGVFTSGPDSKRLTVLGPGEMIGDMSLVEMRPPTESVIALEQSLLLVLPHTLLEAQFAQDSGFAARFYRSSAATLSRRLRLSNSKLLAAQHTADAPDVEGIWKRVDAVIAQLKDAFQAADAAAIKNFGQVPDSVEQELVDNLHQFFVFLDDQIGDAAAENPRL